MAVDNVLVSRYLSQQVVRQRNSITLNQWAAYTGTLPIPQDPDDNWIRSRVIAEQIPLSLDQTVQQTLAYFLQDPAVVENIAKFISPDNDTATEQDLAAKNQNIVGTFMPRYAMSVVNAMQIQQWREKNGLVANPATASPIATGPHTTMQPPAPPPPVTPAQSAAPTSTHHSSWFSGGHKQS